MGTAAASQQSERVNVDELPRWWVVHCHVLVERVEYARDADGEILKVALAL